MTHSSSSSSLPHQHWVKTSLPPPIWVHFVPPRAGSCGSLTPPSPDPPGGLCPGFRACPAARTLLGPARLGSGGVRPTGITGTPVSLRWAVSSVTPHRRAERHFRCPQAATFPSGGGGGAHFPPARGTLALLSFFLSVSSFRQFPRQRFLPFASQLESPGPRSCLGPAAPWSPPKQLYPQGHQGHGS